MISPVRQKVAHNGLYTPQGAEKDYRNDIGPMTRGNNVKRIETLCKMCDKKEILLLLLLLLLLYKHAHLRGVYSHPHCRGPAKPVRYTGNISCHDMDSNVL